MPPLANSPDSFGAHRYACFYVQGPATYTRITVTSPPSLPSAGGQIISGADCGLSAIEFVIGGASDSGLYFVRAIPVSASNGRGGQQQSTYRLAWYVAAGTEVPTGFTLSAEYIRLIAFGIK